MRTQVIIILCTVLVNSEILNYKGFTLYEVRAQNERQSQVLYKISATNFEIHFLNLVRLPNITMYVVVPPKSQQIFESTLNQNSIQFQITNSDFSQLMKTEDIPSPRSDIRDIYIQFNRYYNYSEINNYLDTLANLYPDRVRVKTVGYSYEKKPIKTITISNGLPRNKNIILIDAGMHGRELIAPATALYLIYQLVEVFDVNKDLLENYDFVVLPLVNPDGYDYSQTTDPLWRKTRKPNFGCGFGINSNSNPNQEKISYNACDEKDYQFTNITPCVFFCGFGTDGNRNFDSHWSESGSSYYGCTSIFHGEIAFSESESQTVRDVMHSVAGRAKMYISLHTYGGMIVYPWGYKDELPTDWEDMNEVANEGATAIKNATGHEYKIGSTARLMYLASGNSADYALEKVGIPISLTMELSENSEGFDPSPSKILSLVDEGWIGIRAMVRRVQQKYL